MVFFRNFEGIFEIQNQSAVGNAEVRTNLFEKIRVKGHFVVFFELIWIDKWDKGGIISTLKVLNQGYGMKKSIV